MYGGADIPGSKECAWSQSKAKQRQIACAVGTSVPLQA